MPGFFAAQRVDKQKIKKDTGKVIEKGTDLIDDAKDEIDDATSNDNADYQKAGLSAVPVESTNEASPASVPDDDVLPELPKEHFTSIRVC